VQDSVEAPKTAWIKAALKVAVSVGLLTILVWKLDLGLMWHELAQMSFATGLGILGVVALQVIVSVMRWRRVLLYLRRSERFGALLSDLLVGRAFDLVLPTQIGGDVARALRSAPRVGRADAWAAIAYERMVGLLMLALLPALGLLMKDSALPAGVGLGIGAVALVLGITLFFADSVLAWAARITRALPRVANELEHLTEAFRGGLASWGARAETAIWSLLKNLLNLTVLLLAGASWAQADFAAAMLIGVPVVLVGSMVPISFGGLGVRESLFVIVLGLFGVSADRALALSVVWVAALLPPALAGLAVLALERSARVSPQARAG